MYVEDVRSTEFYRTILQRILPKHIRIHTVFEAGCKSEVLTQCQSHDFAARPAVFIVDGDFEWVRNDSVANLQGLFRLDAYCIENLLFDKTSIVEYAFFVAGGALSMGEVEEALALPAWLDAVRREILPLFEMFAVAHKLCPALPTVSRGVGCVVKQVKDRPEIDSNKVKALIHEINRELLKRHTQQQIDAEIESVRRRIRKLPKSRHHDAISGKSFLLPLLRFRIFSIVSDRASDKAFKLRLAANCPRRRFSALKKFVTASVR